MGGSKLKEFMEELDNVIIKKEELEKKTEEFVRYLMLNLHHNKSHAFRYSTLEVFNLLHICGQIYLADVILQGEFISYGMNVLSYSRANNVTELIDPMALNFPLVTHCEVMVTGPSGNRMNWSGICIMTLNKFLERAFIVIWYVTFTFALLELGRI
jgi:hypothetical protein